MHQRAFSPERSEAGMQRAKRSSARHPPFASAAEQAKFELYAQGASEASSRQWAGQPGNFQLMVKQG